METILDAALEAAAKAMWNRNRARVGNRKKMVIPDWQSAGAIERGITRREIRPEIEAALAVILHAAADQLALSAAVNGSSTQEFFDGWDACVSHLRHLSREAI